MSEIGTITREELKGRVDREDDLVLLEVLGAASYGRGHLPGAVRAQNPDHAEAEIPSRDAFVVARALVARGYGNVYGYEGGKRDWVEASLPLET